MLPGPPSGRARHALLEIHVTAITLARPASASIWAAATAVDARRPRSQQTQLGASDTVCQRRAGYVVHRVPRTDTPDTRPAILGTYIHTGLLESARTEYGWLVERLVEDNRIRGHIDVVQLDAATAARLPKRHRPVEPAEVVTVEDVKTKSSMVWDRVLRYGPTPAEMRQVLLYADLLRTVGFADVPGQRYLHRLGPVDVQRIRFRFVCRDNGEEDVQEFAFDPWLAEQARWWVDRVLEAGSPEELTRDHDGPGLAVKNLCDYCPWASACWPGRAPGRPVQTMLVHDDADRAEVLAGYVRDRERIGEATKRQVKRRAMIDDSPEGIYGANKLAWSGGKPKDEVDVEALVDTFENADLTVPMRPDVDRMVKVARLAGVAVPMRTSAGRKTPRSINVTRAPKST
ncbi:PD-(D/E)XK nuclease family protein [Streptomyces syringium]|uniref:PD-(D/E)XK nuclease family protein n=1 Tax=Streptomyces syringium TaxID=76729 RepID=UPI003D90C4AB